MRPDAAPLSIRLFGPFQISVDGQPLPRLRFRKSEALLALLALRPGQTVQRDWLLGLLWPEGQGTQSLRNGLTGLRHALGAEAGRLTAPTSRTLRLDLTGAFVDVLAFDAALARGAEEERLGRAADRGHPRSGSWGRSPGEALEEAVGLYCGPLLEGWNEEWLFQARQQREQGYLAALESLAALAMERGDSPAAERHLWAAITADPLRESAQRGLMQPLAQLPMQPLAYRELRQRLHRELNAEPDPETRTLFQQLRAEARRLQERPAARRRSATSAGPSPLFSPPVTEDRSPTSGAERSSRVTPGGENRLVTVLFAERSLPVGAMQDPDPEAAAALVNRLLGVMVDAILKFGGQIDRCLGDGVLAIFGVAQAHEDDAERAIRAAVSIREAARDLGTTITAGINTGDVYLAGAGAAPSGPGRGGGPPERQPGVTIAGAVVGSASRLQREAEPGQILVGESAYRQTRRAFEFSPLSLTIRGLDQPVAAYAVERARTRPEKARGIEGLRAELIGRDQELAKLKAALADLARGRGQMVSVIGDAGVGKSRLVAELRRDFGSWILDFGFWIADKDGRTRPTGAPGFAGPIQNPLVRGPRPRAEQLDRLLGIHRPVPRLFRVGQRGRRAGAGRAPGGMAAGGGGSRRACGGAGCGDGAAAGKPARRPLQRVGRAAAEGERRADPVPDLPGGAGLPHGAGAAPAGAPRPRGPALGRQSLLEPHLPADGVAGARPDRPPLRLPLRATGEPLPAHRDGGPVRAARRRRRAEMPGAVHGDPPARADAGAERPVGGGAVARQRSAAPAAGADPGEIPGQPVLRRGADPLPHRRGLAVPRTRWMEGAYSGRWDC